MAITNREELVEALARIGIMGLAREGYLDSLFYTKPEGLDVKPNSESAPETSHTDNEPVSDKE